MDEPVFCGCVVHARLIGVIDAEQTERDGTCSRNDRLIAVAAKCRNYEDLRSIKDMNKNLREEIEHFFASYNKARGKRFKVLGQRGAEAATKLVKAGVRKARQRGKGR
jgi:inorganic pyrophosphatase